MATKNNNKSVKASGRKASTVKQAQVKATPAAKPKRMAWVSYEDMTVEGIAAHTMLAKGLIDERTVARVTESGVTVENVELLKKAFGRAIMANVEDKHVGQALRTLLYRSINWQLACGALVVQTGTSYATDEDKEKAADQDESGESDIDKIF